MIEVVNKYVMTLNQFFNFNTALWSLSEDDLLKAQTYFATPIDSILSVRWYPFPASTIGGSAQVQVNLANIAVGSITAARTSVDVVEFSVSNIDITRKYNDYRDFKTDVDIYLPFVGIHKLDVRQYMGKKLTVKYKFDLNNGQGLCELHLIDSTKTAPSNDVITDNLLFNGGYDVPISAFATPSETLRNLTQRQSEMGVWGAAVGGGVAGFKTLGPLGALGGAVASTLAGAQSMALKMTEYDNTHRNEFNHSGDFGNGFQLMSGANIVIMYRYPQFKYHGGTFSNKIDLVGLPSYGTVDQIINLHGFIQGELTAPVFGSGLVLKDEEKIAIAEAIKTGIYNNSINGETMYSKYVAPYLI